MFKYSFDFKFKAVKYVVYGKYSYREAARKFNVHQEQIRVWTNRYKTYGKNGLIPKPIQKYDGKFKVDVVEYMYANHLSFEIIDFQEIEKDGETALNGVKHWHIYNIIARKK